MQGRLLPAPVRVLLIPFVGLDHAIPQSNDPISTGSNLICMGDHDNCLSFGIQGFKKFEQFIGGLGIKVTCGLICKSEIGIAIGLCLRCPK